MAKKEKAKAVEEGYADDPNSQPISTFEDGDDALTINMDNVQEQVFENLPVGTYECVIEKSEYKLSKSSGKPMWNLMLSVVDGEYSGRKLFHMISFSEGALPGSKAQIARIAPALLSSSFNPKKIADNGDLVGVACRAKVVMDTYEGETRNKVKQLLAPSAGNGGEFA